jgi:hypothetical protein
MNDGIIHWQPHHGAAPVEVSAVQQEIDAIAAEYVAKGWTDLGLVSGTRTLRMTANPADAALSLHVAIWLQQGDRPRVVSEEY